MINVKDVGAKGDGQTNDTQAIQAAINDIPVEGVSLFFSAGTYILSAPILVQGKSIGLIAGV